MNIKNYLESTDNHLSSSGFFSQDTPVESVFEIQMKMTSRRTKPEEFPDRIIFMSMLHDID